MSWVATIGLEVHAQLQTRRKLFCGCPTDVAVAAEERVCPVCLGHPGAMPVLNAEAVELAVRAARALGASVRSDSCFDRKHYFYPDLPKGYQITQRRRPLCSGGHLDVALASGRRRFGLIGAHLEEDAGRSGGAGDVDWSRAGVPLIEVVGAPDIPDPDAAERWMRALHRTLVDAGVCGGNMQLGQLRCDANISLARDGAPPGTRVEIKNLNSFRFVGRALRGEIERQSAILDAGGRIDAETRGWNGRGAVSLRGKPTVAEYRFMPEPDLPSVDVSAALAACADLPLGGLSEWTLDQAEARVSALTTAHQLHDRDARSLLARPGHVAFFEAAVGAGASPSAALGWMLGEIARQENLGHRLSDSALTPKLLVQMIGLVDVGRLTRPSARALFPHLWAKGGDAEQVAGALGLLGGMGETELRQRCRAVIGAHGDMAARYRSGNSGMLGFFMGRLMCGIGSPVDPRLANRILREELEA